MNFGHGPKIGFIIAIVLASSLLLIRIGLAVNLAFEDDVMEPVDCYKFGTKISFNEFLNKYVSQLKSNGYIIKLPPVVLGKYRPSTVWVCDVGVYIVAYTDGKPVDNYFDAPFAIEVAVVPGLSEYYKPINVKPSQSVSLNVATPTKVTMYNGFEVYIIDYRTVQDDIFDYTFVAYDLNNDVRYSMGLKHDLHLSEDVIYRILGSFKAI